MCTLDEAIVISVSVRDHDSEESTIIASLETANSRQRFVCRAARVARERKPEIKNDPLLLAPKLDAATADLVGAAVNPDLHHERVRLRSQTSASSAAPS